MFDQISSFANLHLAARRAARGKRYRPSVAEFLLRMEAQCLSLSEELRTGTWQPGGYRVFEIVDPKRRTICAAPFRDRVVHQAMVQVVEPLFERGFIADSYSCRKGKGTHAALLRVQKWARTYPWAMKLDVEKYFASIDHSVVMRLLAKKLRCAKTIDLFAQVLATWQSSESPRRWFSGDDLFGPLDRARGLPIGNLTSQFLSNVVLDHVDHAVKDGLGTRAYARYCDDMVVLSQDVAELKAVRERVVASLADIRLRLHRDKSQILPTEQGITWVGFRVAGTRTWLRPKMLSRVRRRMRALAGRSNRSAAAQQSCRQSMAAMQGHVGHGLAPGLLAQLALS